LDNDYNSGTDYDDAGNKIPPNENYARELMQLFSLGTSQLNLDGTPITDANGVPLPPYTETDVREVARALTGWHVDYDNFSRGMFEPYDHDSDDKVILGVTVTGRQGDDGANEVNDVINILMAQPTNAPFISKILIQKLATETPTAGYVERVATVFKNSGGDIKATVRAILNDDEFISAGVVQTQYKEPIEQFVGPLRALKAKTQGGALADWTNSAQQMIYYPPSVFSFYPPGQKGNLVNTALVTERDI